MRRDTIFYQLFRQSPTLLFSLIANPPNGAEAYTFDSVEVKETSFRIDGVFLPPHPTELIYFCEVQFQTDPLLYERMNSEISIYAYRQRSMFRDWRAIVIYPSRDIEQARTETVDEFLSSGRITRVYLDQLGPIEALPVGLKLMVLTTLEGETAIDTARSMITEAQTTNARAIIELISTIIVYKFTTLSREAVDAMIGITLQQTRVYQDAFAEGEARGELRLVKRLLTRQLGEISAVNQAKLKQLSTDELEALHDAALDFTQASDLTTWLNDQAAPSQD
jgi:predicted transposase/invertase (TIGR01784 family)